MQIKTLDLAKRLLDFGFHPPTVYFPLLVEEALMVEPTETETRETLDAFADAIAEILREAAEDPEIARRRPPHHAGAAPGRGRRGQAAGHSPGLSDGDGRWPVAGWRWMVAGGGVDGCPGRGGLCRPGWTDVEVNI